jgi:BirA family biotin operon repressor/biotin-[acetyl-CoA-carboxylase] ligase
LNIKDEVQQKLHAKTLGKTLLFFDILESTNDTADQLARDGEPEGTLVIAEEQSRGRGRAGRTWFSERGAGLYFSLILRPQIQPQYAPVLSLAAAVAVHQALQEVCGVTAEIKWPNDLLIRNRKCCGILLEQRSDTETVKYLVLGIGVNLHNRSFPPDLAGRATSLFLETGLDYSKVEILRVILKHFEPTYVRFSASGSGEIIESWMERSAFANEKRVVVEVGSRRIQGTTAGISTRGGLQILLEDGRIEEIVGGNVVSWE